jgi:molecular chaperone DnaJ
MFIYGGEARASIQRTSVCSTCNGSRGEKSICPQCNGAKQVSQRQGMYAVIQPCPNCQGEGQIVHKPCITCLGVGHKNENEIVTFFVPENCPISATLKINGKGNNKLSNVPPGDVYILLVPKFDNGETVNVSGDVELTQNITLDQWISNNSVEINRFGVEKLYYNLSDLKNSKQIASFLDKGLRNNQNTKQGSLFVTFNINK